MSKFKKIPGSKYSITPKAEPKGQAMPIRSVPEQMKTKDNTSGGSSKGKNGDSSKK